MTSRSSRVRSGSKLTVSRALASFGKFGSISDASSRRRRGFLSFAWDEASMESPQLTICDFSNSDSCPRNAV